MNNHSLKQKIIMICASLPLISMLLLIHLSGCVSSRTFEQKSDEELMEEMRRNAEKIAYESLKKYEGKKAILMVIGAKFNGESFDKWLGSSFVVEHNHRQYLVSATHVVPHRARFGLYQNGESIRFEIEEWFSYKDASVFLIKDGDFDNTFELDFDFMKEVDRLKGSGQIIECSAIGFTKVGLRRTDGFVIGLYTDKEDDNVKYIISSNPVVEGMSGGVLINDRGQAVAVISSFVNGPERWGRYIPIASLIRQIEKKLKKKAPDQLGPELPFELGCQN